MGGLRGKKLSPGIRRGRRIRRRRNQGGCCMVIIIIGIVSILSLIL